MYYVLTLIAGAILALSIRSYLVNRKISKLNEELKRIQEETKTKEQEYEKAKRNLRSIFDKYELRGKDDN